jgi:hypothetical protein
VTRRDVIEDQVRERIVPPISVRRAFLAAAKAALPVAPLQRMRIDGGESVVTHLDEGDALLMRQAPRARIPERRKRARVERLP